jgi:ABC-type molybdate transport system permease subunit
LFVGPAGCAGSGGGTAGAPSVGSFPGVTQTIPLAIFAARESNFDAAAALSVKVLVFAFTVILVARFLLGKAAEFASS